MKATMTGGGELHIESETGIEAYALNTWAELYATKNGPEEAPLVINREPMTEIIKRIYEE